MMDYLEHKIYELNCFSPVHIGSGETLKKYEYLYDNTKHIVYFPDRAKWVSLLQRHGIFDDFLNYVNDPAKLTEMNGFAWLTKEHRVQEKEILATASHKALTPKDVSVSKGGRRIRQNINDIITAATLADGRLYIPGSSIKGALRTGVLYHLIKSHPEKVARIESDISGLLRLRNRRDIDRESNRIEKKLEDEMLNVLKFDSKTSAIKSSMRGLMVSDAIPTGRFDSVIVQKNDGVLERDGRTCGENRISLFRECIPADSKMKFRISMDKRMMGEIGVNSIDEIVGFTREFTKAQVKELKKAFGRDAANRLYDAMFQEAADADMFLGGGTGFLSKTFWVALFANNRTEMIRALLEKITPPKHSHNMKDRVISPRTLKLAEVDKDTWLMGMCQLREIK